MSAFVLVLAAGMVVGGPEVEGSTGFEALGQRQQIDIHEVEAGRAVVLAPAISMTAGAILTSHVPHALSSGFDQR